MTESVVIIEGPILESENAVTKKERRESRCGALELEGTAPWIVSCMIVAAVEADDPLFLLGHL
jgi:hypothetical protein